MLRCSVLFVAVASIAAPLLAQVPSDSVVHDPNRITAVVIETSDVYTQEQANTLVARILNGLHITTRHGVIRREVLLRPGEVYDSARAAETERGLRALRIFRRVAVDSVRSDSGLVLRVRTQDAFTTRFEFSIVGSDESRSWAVSVNELNLLGTATRVMVRYRRTPDREGVTTSFQRHRLIGGRVGLTAFYDRRSDGHTVYGDIAQPFFSYSSPTSWFVSGEQRDERVLRFAEGNPDPAAILERRFWLARTGVGHALSRSPSGYVRLGVNAQLRRDDYAAQSRVDTLGRSVSGAITPFVQWRAGRLLVRPDFAGIGPREGVDPSTPGHFLLGVAPEAFGYRDNGVVPTLSAYTGLGWRRGFARFSTSAHARFTDAGVVDSGAVHLAGLVVLKPAPRQMAVFHAARGWQKNPMPGAEFDLGLGLGPRGFRAHAFSGDRAFLIGTELRYTVFDDFLNSAGLGVAAFGEYGGAWYGGAPVRAGYSVGLGLRFGLTFASDLSPARLDFAYTGGDGLDRPAWRVAFGKGFVFNTNGRLDQ